MGAYLRRSLAREMKAILRDAYSQGIDIAAIDIPMDPNERNINVIWKRNQQYVDRIVRDFVAAVRSGDFQTVKDIDNWFEANAWRERLMARHLAKQGITAGFADAVQRTDGANFTWVRTILESCDSCVERGDEVFSFETLVAIGFPGSDSLDCGANCHCILLPTMADSTWYTTGNQPAPGYRSAGRLMTRDDWTAADEAKHPRDEKGKFAKKDIYLPDAEVSNEDLKWLEGRLAEHLPNAYMMISDTPASLAARKIDPEAVQALDYGLDSVARYFGVTSQAINGLVLVGDKDNAPFPSEHHLAQAFTVDVGGHPTIFLRVSLDRLEDTEPMKWVMAIRHEFGHAATWVHQSASGKAALDAFVEGKWGKRGEDGVWRLADGTKTPDNLFTTGYSRRSRDELAAEMFAGFAPGTTFLGRARAPKRFRDVQDFFATWSEQESAYTGTKPKPIKNPVDLALRDADRFHHIDSDRDWTAEDESKHPREKDGTFAKKIEDAVQVVQGQEPVDDHWAVATSNGAFDEIAENVEMEFDRHQADSVEYMPAPELGSEATARILRKGDRTSVVIYQSRDAFAGDPARPPYGGDRPEVEGKAPVAMMTFLERSYAPYGEHGPGRILGVVVRKSERGIGYGTGIYDFVQDHVADLVPMVGQAKAFTQRGKQFALQWLHHRLRLLSRAITASDVEKAIALVQDATVSAQGFCSPEEDGEPSSFHVGTRDAEFEGEHPRDDKGQKFAKKPLEVLDGEQLHAIRMLAIERWRADPLPTEEEVHQQQELYAKLGAAKAESNQRGNTADRRASRRRLAREFLDSAHAPCVYCGAVLSWDHIERDRIIPGAVGGRYRNENLVPACQNCNLARGSRPFEITVDRWIEEDPKLSRQARVHIGLGLLPKAGTLVKATEATTPDSDFEPKEVTGSLDTRWVECLDYMQTTVGGYVIDPNTIEVLDTTAARDSRDWTAEEAKKHPRDDKGQFTYSGGDGPVGDNGEPPVTKDRMKELDAAADEILKGEAAFYAGGSTIDGPTEHTHDQRDRWIADANNLYQGLGNPKDLELADRMIHKALWNCYTHVVALTREGWIAGVYGFYERTKDMSLEGLTGKVGDGYMGSWAIVKGAGAAMFASLVRYAADRGYWYSEEFLPESVGFWRRMGARVSELLPISGVHSGGLEANEVAYLAGKLGKQP